MIKATCAGDRQVNKKPKITVKDCGKSVVIGGCPGKGIHVVKVDGGLVKHQCAADYVLSKVGIGDLIIELKGQEIGRACEQIFATVDILRQCKKSAGRLAGLVICNRSPRADTKAQRLIEKFKKTQRGLLRVKTGDCFFEFDSFFPGVSAR